MTQQLIQRDKLLAKASPALALRGIALQLDESWATAAVRASIIDGLHEVEEADVIGATLEPEDRVLDVGCGAGFVATLAALKGAPTKAFDADPAMVRVTGQTLAANDATAEVVHAAIVAHDPEDGASVSFFVHDDFVTSSLKSDVRATRIDVPTRGLRAEIVGHGASYLIMDVEGAEVELLSTALPGCVRKICVECHPAVTSPSAVTRMIDGLIDQDFELDLGRSRLPVLFFERT